MSYINKRHELEIGEIYVLEYLNTPRRKDPGHWHNSYYVPTEEKSDHLTVCVINKGIEPTSLTTNTIKNKLYAKVTDRPGVKRKVLKFIFE